MDEDDPFARLDREAQQQSKQSAGGDDPFAELDPKAPEGPPQQGWLPYLGGKADAFVRAAANAATFGMADRLAGAANRATGLTDAPDYNTAVDEEVAKSAAARAESPYVSVGGDVAGVAAAAPRAGGAYIYSKLAPTAGKWARAGARAVGYGTEGAILGAAQGAGGTYTGETKDYLENAGLGGVLGLGLGAAGGAAFGPRTVPGTKTSTAAVPTSAEARTAANKSYDDLFTNTARYPSGPIVQRMQDLESHMMGRKAFTPTNAPTTFEEMARIANARTPVQAPGSLELVRQRLNKISKGPDSATDREASRYLKGEIDDLLINPKSVVPGTEAGARTASKTAKDARGDWAASSRGKVTGGIMEMARQDAGATFSGLGYENILRRRVRDLLKPQEFSPTNARRLAGFNAAERGALDAIADPSFGTKALRWGGNVLGGGGGVAVPVAGGVAGGAAGQYFKDNPIAGSAVGFGAPAVGLGLRLLSNRRAQNQMQAVHDMTMMRSPEYARRVAASPMASAPDPRLMPGARDAITLGLLRQNRGYPVTVYKDSATEEEE